MKQGHWIRRFRILPIILLLAGCVATGNVETLRSDVNQLKREYYAQKQEIAGLKQGLRSLEGVSSKAVSREVLEAIRGSQERIHNQLTELNRDVQLLQGRYDEDRYATEQALKDSETERSLLRSQIEELGNEVRQLTARLQALEERGNTISKSKGMPVTGKPSKEKTPPVTEEGTYQHALTTFREGKFREARKEFEDFLKKYPNSNLSDNAQFWIAESYYKEGDHEEAILAYETLIRKFPKSDKIPGAMLKRSEERRVGKEYRARWSPYD